MLLTKIYCQVDDFCKKHEKYLETMNLSYGMGKTKGVRRSWEDVYGLVLGIHLTMNGRGELLNFVLTPGNVNDCNPD